jgi:hypothetical protein
MSAARRSGKPSCDWENEGLVVNRPNRGATVTTLGPDAMLELFEMRSVLEGLAFGLAVPNVDAKGIAEMERRLDALERSHTNITRWVQLHDDFHGLLFQHARRPRLSPISPGCAKSVAPYLRLLPQHQDHCGNPGNEHRSLIEAIKTAMRRRRAHDARARDVRGTRSRRIHPGQDQSQLRQLEKMNMSNTLSPSGKSHTRGLAQDCNEPAGGPAPIRGYYRIAFACLRACAAVHFGQLGMDTSGELVDRDDVRAPKAEQALAHTSRSCSKRTERR